MAAKIYWRDARFRPNDDWMRENMDRSLVKLSDVPFPDQIPDFSCCPFGTNMVFDVEGKRIVLPSDYRSENPEKFGEYDSKFRLLGDKIKTNGVFAGYKPLVAEALRRNEKWFFNVADEKAQCTKDQHRRKVVEFQTSYSHGTPNSRTTEYITYDVILSGIWVKAIGKGRRGNATQINASMSVRAGTPAYAESLYKMFDNDVILNELVENAGAKDKGTDTEMTLAELIDKNHNALEDIVRYKLHRIGDIEWAVRQIADHPRFKDSHPDITLELMVA